MHIQSLEQTVLNFLSLGKYIFPLKKFHNINYRNSFVQSITGIIFATFPNIRPRQEQAGRSGFHCQGRGRENLISRFSRQRALHSKVRATLIRRNFFKSQFWPILLERL